MELFIKIVDGQPFEHPILGDNFRQAFPDIDTENLPSNFAKFVRIERPTVTALQIVEGPEYQWIDGVVKDVWTVREMNETERANEIEIRTNFANEMYQELLTFVQNKLTTETNETAIAALNDWLVELNAWTLVDPLNPNVPHAPEILKQLYRPK